MGKQKSMTAPNVSTNLFRRSCVHPCPSGGRLLRRPANGAGTPVAGSKFLPFGVEALAPAFRRAALSEPERARLVDVTDFSAAIPARAAHICPVEQSGCYWIGRCHGGKGAGRSPSIRCRISTNRVLGMAPSAIWKVMQRPWRTTFAPILISFSRTALTSAYG